MSSNFKIYRNAAVRVRQGWAQKAFSDSHGNQCLVQSVLTSAEQSGFTLSAEMIHELDVQLQQFADYRAYRVAMLTCAEGDMPAFVARWMGKHTYFPLNTREHALQVAIMMWNDAPYRRKKTVVNVLKGLSDKLELEWLRAEHARLSNEVEVLRNKVNDLQNENGRLKRLTNSFALRADRRELESLERELNRTWNELQAQPTVS